MVEFRYMELQNFSNNEIIQLYGKIIKELKRRWIVRTKNLLGDLGEYLTVEYYNTIPWLPNLQLAPAWTQNVDAISRKWERYSIKSISWRVTWVFYGLNDPDTTWPEKQICEYVVIVIFWDNFILDQIIEIDWETFLRFKKWHSTMRWWNVSITKNLLKEGKIIYKNNEVRN